MVTRDSHVLDLVLCKHSFEMIFGLEIIILRKKRMRFDSAIGEILWCIQSC